MHVEDDRLALRPSDLSFRMELVEESLKEFVQNQRRMDIARRLWSWGLFLCLVWVVALPSWAPLAFALLVFTRVIWGTSGFTKQVEKAKANTIARIEAASSLIKVMNASNEEVPALPPKPILPEAIRALLDEHIARHRIGDHSARRLREAAEKVVQLVRSGEPCTQRLLRIVETVSGPPWEANINELGCRASETKLLFQMRIPGYLQRSEGVILEPTLANWVGWLKLAESWFTSGVVRSGDT